MGMNKNKIRDLSLLMGIAASIGGRDIQKPKEYTHQELKAIEDSRNKRLLEKQIQRNRKMGLKEFYYGENLIWAINQKNADRKAIKKGFFKKKEL